jgi:hypothetical protein
MSPRPFSDDLIVRCHDAQRENLCHALGHLRWQTRLSRRCIVAREVMWARACRLPARLPLLRSRMEAQRRRS